MWDFFRPVPKRRMVKIRKGRGIIFNNPNQISKFIFHLGNIILLLSVIYTVYLYFPLAGAVLGYWKSANSPVAVTADPRLVPTPNVATEIGSTEYSITIPRIGAFANIVKNVSPFDQKEYSRILKDSVVAQAKGSSDVGAGLGKSTFIFAHSTEQGISMVRQNSLFYLLGELKNNDVIFVDKEGEIYTYQVYMQKIVNASEIEYLKYSDPEREVLILQTCWPIGTDWKRLLVFGQRVK
ncbi:MAG: sortase [Microgenomates group bacterium]